MNRPPRVALAGLFHETHVFLDGTTGLDAFARRVGTEILGARGDGSPLDGVLEVAERHGWNLIPTVDLRATPSATAEDSAVEAFWTDLKSGVDEAREAGGLDALFLVLHGAMASVSHPDVEGEILARLAEHLGTGRPPVFGVLDLHANIGPLGARRVDALLAYR
ncbi:MAG: M81 family metallopeptidase, partial [Trueperaceae bacterium]